MPDFTALLAGCRKYRTVCQCGVKKKTYALLGPKSKVLCCPICDNEESILETIEECWPTPPTLSAYIRVKNEKSALTGSDEQ